MAEEFAPLANPVFRKISRIVDALGVEAYVVGGYVRDYYLRRPSTDIDVVVVGSGIEVAEALGVSPQSVRIGLQRGELPFGSAIKTSSKYTYVIYPQKVKEYIGL